PTTLLPFFLSSHLTHLYLHSFPTQRSSDLPGSRGLACRTKSCLPLPCSCWAGERETGMTRPLPCRLCEYSPPGSRLHAIRHPSKDRKSTRLNSSHVSISYAVFCLKK